MTPQTQLQSFAGIGALSSLAAGIGQYKAGQYEKEAYQYNADITTEKTRQEVEASAARYAALSGKERALYAKAGVDISSGSPLLIAMNTAAQGAVESTRIQRSGAQEAKLLRYYGKVASWSGKISGLTTFLTGLGRANMDYVLAKKF